MKVHIIDHCCNISRSYIDSFKMVNDITFVDFDEADIICYIGCAYTKERIYECTNEINDLLAKKNPNAKFSIFGCITSYQNFFNYFKYNKNIDYIGIGYGQEMQKELTRYLEMNLNNQELFYTTMGVMYENPERISIVVQDGCTNRCAFCKSNYLNLKLKSTPFEDALTQIKCFTSNTNISEIDINGLNPAEYGIDLYHKPRLAELIREISKISTIETILLEELCLDKINNELLNEILTNPKIKRVMIPIQSMDDRLLKLMGRKYTSDEAYNILNSITIYRPDIFLEVIFLNCYPTETIESINKNIKLLKEIKIHNPILSIYKYGSNVKSLKSENIVDVSPEEYQYLLDYHKNNMIPLIEEQRKQLLSKPIEGKLIYKEEDYDYYSTFYRFTINEFMIKCTPDDSINLGQKVLLESEFLPSIPNQTYRTMPHAVKGRVLKKY